MPEYFNAIEPPYLGTDDGYHPLPRYGDGSVINIDHLEQAAEIVRQTHVLVAWQQGDVLVLDVSAYNGRADEESRCPARKAAVDGREEGIGEFMGWSAIPGRRRILVVVSYHAPSVLPIVWVLRACYPTRTAQGLRRPNSGIALSYALVYDFKDSCICTPKRSTKERVHDCPDIARKKTRPS